MKVVQRDHKLDSYTPTPYLNTIGDQKDDITQETFRLQEGATLTERQSPNMCARLRSVQLSLREIIDGRR
jgi:hypothetical protein